MVLQCTSNAIITTRDHVFFSTNPDSERSCQRGEQGKRIKIGKNGSELKAFGK